MIKTKIASNFTGAVSKGKNTGPAGAVIVPIAHQRARSEMKSFVDGITNIRSAQDILPEATIVAANHPSDLLIQSYLLQIKERAGEHHGLLDAWTALYEKNPDDLTIFRFRLRRLIRERHKDEALQILEDRLPENLGDYEAAFARAELLEDIQAFDEADNLFRALIQRYSNKREAYVSFAKRLRKRGLIVDAMEVLAPIANKLPEGGKARQLLDELGELNAMLGKYETADAMRGLDGRMFAMKHAILHFRNREIDAESSGNLQSLALITGSVGPGGAERQLSRMACLLESQRNSAEEGNKLKGKLEVIVKAHNPEKRGDFFLPELLACGVTVRQINDMPSIQAKRQEIADDDLLKLLEFLPTQVHYGVTRLAPHLRENKFEVVSLWQDGTCLFGALAALLAGARTVQLFFRGLPPNIRHDRFKPEYEILYRALAEVPGVQFVSNSKAAAQEYSAWLDIPIDRFAIIYNGVPPQNASGSKTDEQLWEEFAQRTTDATETVGGVFRFEPDKQPFQWIRMARRYLKKKPTARFVIVGHGRLFHDAEKLAEELGVRERILFVGHSSAVGFWYSKMDVKVLLSRYEGLPNVLIEAQYLGVPVVSTPAGGASECFKEGTTGHILGCAENPCLDEVCDKISSLATKPRDEIAEKAVQFVTALFSVKTTMDSFFTLSTPTSGALAAA